MKTKLIIFALSMSLFSLAGCVASGPGYGYYPPAQPYYGYGYGRPYYAPRPVIVAPRPYYRPGYGGGYHGSDGGYHGGGYGGHGGGGHGRGH